MLQDVSKMTRSEIESREEQAADAPVVNDKRRSYDVTAESNAAQEPEAIDCGPALPEAPVAEPVAEPVKPLSPKDYPTLYVPSLLGGQIQYRVGELIPWKGVFFLIADVKNEPRPHVILVPVDHTGAHKKQAQSKKFGRG